jgi:hypothetical protein
LAPPADDPDADPRRQAAPGEPAAAFEAPEADAPAAGEPPRPRLPQLTLDDLEQDLAALEARRRRLGGAVGDGDERRFILEALIRNRRNLIELIKAGRFI